MLMIGDPVLDALRSDFAFATLPGRLRRPG